MAAVSKPSSRTIRKHSAKITHWNPENGCSLSRVCTLTPVAAASFWTDVMTCLFHCLSAWRIPHLRARPAPCTAGAGKPRSEEHTSELQSPDHLVCRLLLEKKNIKQRTSINLYA